MRRPNRVRPRLHVEMNFYPNIVRLREEWAFGSTVQRPVPRGLRSMLACAPKEAAKRQRGKGRGGTDPVSGGALAVTALAFRLKTYTM